MLTYTTGSRRSRTQRAHDVLAIALLVQLVRRGVEHHEHLRAGRARQLRRLRLPDVLADQDADAEAAELDHRGLRRRT